MDTALEVPGVVPHSPCLFLTRFHFHHFSVSSLRYVQQVSYSWETPGNDTNFNSTLEHNFVGKILHNRWRWGEAARESHPWGTAHHTTWPSMTTALRSVVIAPKPVMSWIKSLFKGDIFSPLFLLQWDWSPRSNKSCNRLNASGKLSISFPSLCVISQPKYYSHINVNENLNTHNVRCVTRDMCPAWQVSHKWENYVHHWQSTA